MDKQKKLQELRVLWKSTLNPIDRKVIETRAKLLHMSMSDLEKIDMQMSENFEKKRARIVWCVRNEYCNMYLSTVVLGYE